MSPQTDDRFAELLRRVLEEGLDPASEEGRELAGGDDDLASRVDEAQRVVALLDRSGRTQRAELEETHAAEDAQAREQVRRFVEARAAEAAAARARRWWTPLAAAAALAILWLGWSLRDPQTLPTEIHMGGTIALETPVEDGDPLDSFTWSYELARGGWFTLVVQDPAAPVGEAELARIERLTESRWSPDDSERAGWPEEITWEVLAHDGTGKVEASAFQRVARAPR